MASAVFVACLWAFVKAYRYNVSDDGFYKTGSADLEKIAILDQVIIESVDKVFTIDGVPFFYKLDGFGFGWYEIYSFESGLLVATDYDLETPCGNHLSGDHVIESFKRNVYPKYMRWISKNIDEYIELVKNVQYLYTVAERVDTTHDMNMKACITTKIPDEVLAARLKGLQKQQKNHDFTIAFNNAAEEHCK